MVHQRQSLPLLLEALEHRPGIHSGLDELEGDLAPDRLGLLGDPDVTHAAFADLFLERVPPGDDEAGLGDRAVYGRSGGGRRRWAIRPGGLIESGLGNAVEDATGQPVGVEETLDAAAELVVAGAGLVKESAPLGPGGLGQRGVEDRLYSHRSIPLANATQEAFTGPTAADRMDPKPGHAPCAGRNSAPEDTLRGAGRGCVTTPLCEVGARKASRARHFSPESSPAMEEYNQARA